MDTNNKQAIIEAHDIFSEYLEELVQKCLQSAQFAGLSHDAKQQKKKEIENRFNQIIFDLLLDNLSVEQLEEMEDSEFDNPETLAKIEEFASEIPDFSKIIEKRLNQEVQAIISGT